LIPNILFLKAATAVRGRITRSIDVAVSTPVLPVAEWKRGADRPRTMSTAFAVAATVTSGINTFLGAKDQKDKFNVSWHLLRLAVASKDESQITAAILRGESIINADAL
jgi:hypothetical protein